MRNVSAVLLNYKVLYDSNNLHILWRNSVSIWKPVLYFTQEEIQMVLKAVKKKCLTPLGIKDNDFSYQITTK